MSDCCASSTSATPITIRNAVSTLHGERCPACGKKGKAVATETVQALLAVSLDLLQPSSYFFCRTSGCAVVYFRADGAQTFGEAQVRERVYQKAPDDNEVFICYCFRVSLGLLRAAGAAEEAGAVVDRITRGTQAGLCACEIRNPQGSCCLGNVRVFLKDVVAIPDRHDESR